MTAEKEIIRKWLNRKGYAVFSDINAGHRVIDLIAIRGSEVIHVETMCSTSSVEVKPKEIERKFTGTAREVNRMIKQHAGGTKDYQKWLVMNRPAMPFKGPKGIRIVRFEEVLLEVMDELDRQNYRDPVIRGLQLVKFLLMSDGESLAKLLISDGKNKVQSAPSRDQFIKEYMSNSESIKSLSKYDAILIAALAHSRLSMPEKLAKVLITDILGTRGRYKFMRELLNDKRMRDNLERTLSKRELKEIIERKETTLDKFMK